MDRAKFPELAAMYDRLAAEAAALEAASAPLRAEREALAQEIAPHEARMRALAREIAAIERPRLAELKNQMGALAKSMGSASLSAAVAGQPEG